MLCGGWACESPVWYIPGHLVQHKVVKLQPGELNDSRLEADCCVDRTGTDPYLAVMRKVTSKESKACNKACNNTATTELPTQGLKTQPLATS